MRANCVKRRLPKICSISPSCCGNRKLPLQRKDATDIGRMVIIYMDEKEKVASFKHSKPVIHLKPKRDCVFPSVCCQIATGSSCSSDGWSSPVNNYYQNLFSFLLYSSISSLNNCGKIYIKCMSLKSKAEFCIVEFNLVEE